MSDASDANPFPATVGGLPPGSLFETAGGVRGFVTADRRYCFRLDDGRHLPVPAPDTVPCRPLAPLPVAPGLDAVVRGCVERFLATGDGAALAAAWDRWQEANGGRPEPKRPEPKRPKCVTALGWLIVLEPAYDASGAPYPGDLRYVHCINARTAVYEGGLDRPLPLSAAKRYRRRMFALHRRLKAEQDARAAARRR